MEYSTAYQSWGRVKQARHFALKPPSRHADLPALPAGVQGLPYGLGRSYGDSCLNDEGALYVMTDLDRLIEFNRDTGYLRAEAGCSLAEILKVIVPHGWFLPVTPGTQFVTLGGAVANDVHGKNHHRAGNLGHHVTELELLRSDGSRMTCSRSDNADWFYATIGGLGLTGVITWVGLDLKPINNPYIDHESVKFRNVDEFFDLAMQSDKTHEYTVSWIDCLASGDKLGRGLFMRGNTAPPDVEPNKLPGTRSLSFPFNAPTFLLNTSTIKVFNELYYGRQRRRSVQEVGHYQPFFYPLDSIQNWNRMYGNRGFFQYQCVVPFENSREPIRRILRTISRSGEGSFLAVLKLFGDQVPSEGLLSFPRPGVTLALDFANRGPETLRLFDSLDAIVREADGALYPAKDGRMSASDFKQFYPRWEEFNAFVDPCFMSDFWKRIIA